MFVMDDTVSCVGRVVFTKSFRVNLPNIKIITAGNKYSFCFLPSSHASGHLKSFNMIKIDRQLFCVCRLLCIPDPSIGLYSLICKLQKKLPCSVICW